MEIHLQLKQFYNEPMKTTMDKSSTVTTSESMKLNYGNHELQLQQHGLVITIYNLKIYIYNLTCLPTTSGT